ncbi:hypothetical protein [Paenibacillus sp. y28]|uniref:hypothetical protein n=1 Tax=Paenibacillus sp. y28 TaxID=3129110 RepID=UPI003015EF1F
MEYTDVYPFRNGSTGKGLEAQRQDWIMLARAAFYLIEIEGGPVSYGKRNNCARI